MNKTVTFFVHDKDNIPSRLGDICDDLGFEKNIIFTPETNLIDFDPLQPDLLVSLGSPVSVTQIDDLEYLQQEVEILKIRLASDKPTLGICLGAQLISQALCSPVYKGANGKEFGWHAITVTEEGKKTPAVHLDGEFTQLMHWHGDTFDLPNSATLLASSDLYENQIFSFGKNTMAIQSHPEAKLEPQLMAWTGRLKDEDKKQEILQHAKKMMPFMDRQFRKFMHEWLNGVGLI